MMKTPTAVSSLCAADELLVAVPRWAFEEELLDYSPEDLVLFAVKAATAEEAEERLLRSFAASGHALTAVGDPSRPRWVAEAARLGVRRITMGPVVVFAPDDYPCEYIDEVATARARELLACVNEEYGEAASDNEWSAKQCFKKLDELRGDQQP